MNKTDENRAKGENLPLVGIRVIEIVDGLMRHAGRLLADMGAEVIRVVAQDKQETELARQVEGGKNLDDVWLDQGKSVLEEVSSETLKALLLSADLVLENVSISGNMASGFDLDEWRQRRPELPIISISDFGRGNRFSAWQGTDPVYQALSGNLARSGLAGQPPLLPPGDLCIKSAASQAAYLATLMLYDGLESGQGNWIDFSILEGAVQTLDPGFAIAGSASGGALGDTSWGRPDVRMRYPIFRCHDGYVRICLLSARQWRGMFEWLGSPQEFSGPEFDDLMVRYRTPTLLPAIGRFFADQNIAELAAGANRHRVPLAPVLLPVEALQADQLVEAGALWRAEVKEGVSATFAYDSVRIDGQRAFGNKVPFSRQRSSLFSNHDTRVNEHRPLAGLRVLDLGVIVLGAESGRLLADAGADVIKIENPAYPDGTRRKEPHEALADSFAVGHRNKRSLSINLRSEQGNAIMLDLVRHADIVLSNFKPGTMESLGLGAERLLQVNPGIITVDSSAYGPVGSVSQRMGYGPLVRAASGLTSLWTYPDDKESFSDATTIYPDHRTARLGAMAALAMLIRRRRSGHGGRASTAQSESILDHFSVEYASADLASRGIKVTGIEHDVPWGVYPCAGDDAWCSVSVRNDRDWRQLARVLGMHDKSLEQRHARIAQRERIEEALTQWLATRSARDAMAVLQDAGVPAGAMLRVQELPDFPFYVERGFYRSFKHRLIPHSLYTETRSAIATAWLDPEQRDAALMGEHSVEVLKEWLGLPAVEIAQLIDDGTIGPLPDAQELREGAHHA